MAHWDGERDRRRVQEMRECNLTGTEEIIRNFEDTGDVIYWSQLIEHNIDFALFLHTGR